MLRRAHGGVSASDGAAHLPRAARRGTVAHADALVAVTFGDNSNIVSARTAKEIYRVPVVLARIHDPRRADLCRELGVPAISSVRWAVSRIHQILLHRHLTAEVTFGNGETLLIRSQLPSYLTGRRLSEFDIDGEIRVVEITRAGRSILPAHSACAESGDLVTFAVAATSLGRLRGFLDKDLGT
ncbi:NAD-binding protein [Streptomyces sp. NBC_00568]|uniref:NAD-binding protein n=1 Tax=Streptomyces sp. NBC_00568 TaxID=2975779 RepID=UPI002259D965|nr:NAD-binding protein [Streptomyces sp. NBC_00568]MCX4993148.1 NAD-binding protein [Streptomyces sp. NBC_00568]